MMVLFEYIYNVVFVDCVWLSGAAVEFTAVVAGGKAKS